MSSTSPALPEWAAKMIALYESNAASQFILHGNINDRLLQPVNGQIGLGSLAGFFLRVLMPQFDVILSYDIGNGVRLEKGNETFSQWPGFKENPELPKSPRTSIEFLTRYFRYCANLARLGQRRINVGCIVKAADMVAPALAGNYSSDISSLALLMREWSEEPLLAEHSLVTCLVTENLNDLHPLLVNNARAARIKLPLPPASEISTMVDMSAGQYRTALREFAGRPTIIAEQLAGATFNSIDALLKLKDYRKEPVTSSDLVSLKKQMVEEECQGLIEFIQSTRTLEDVHGQAALKAALRQDIALWQRNDLNAVPMGYLICGPVGTGKTYMVECLAGEAGVPVIKIRNFRDKWVGSTEGNLEKIFRLLQALNRCYVFIDEADQALGKRDSGSGDSGLSGRIYSMIAAEMSRPENRGRVVWILASSRPDLIEVDLKRPGRIDVKVPIFPTSTPEESWSLIHATANRRGVPLNDGDLAQVKHPIPVLLTPGAADALAVKLYRSIRTVPHLSAVDALNQALAGYQNPVPRETMLFQIELAVREASDIDFVPSAFRATQKLGNSIPA